MKRLLDTSYSDILKASKAEKLDSIASCDGRVIVSEVTLLGAPNIGITTSELCASFGADLLLYNALDVDTPLIPGLDKDVAKQTPLAAISRMTGRMVGVNLEPVPSDSDLPEGRRATGENAEKAQALGADFILLTGNPGTGVTNDLIAARLKEINEVVGDTLMIFAGKMHCAGNQKENGQAILTISDIDLFIDAGANVILMPAPGTVPGVTLEYVAKLIQHCHSRGVLTLTAIGTSQEEADQQTLRQIALMCKMAGTDMHHLGDAGIGNIVPESIMAYSIAIRGKRHTYCRMSISPLR